MSSNQSLILTAIEARFTALALGRTKLDYSYDLEKNGSRAEKNAYGFGLGAADEVSGTIKSLTLDQEFFVVLTQNYENRKSDSGETTALTTIYDDLEAITRDFANSKLGAPGIVLVVQSVGLEEPVKISEKTISVRANFTVKHRATITGTATLPDAPVVETPEAYSILKAFQCNGANTYMSAPVRNVGGETNFSVAMTVKMDMTLNSGTEYFWYFYAPEINAITTKFYGDWVNSSFNFGVGSATTTFRPTRADKIYHLVFVYDGAQATATDRAKLYVDGVHTLDASSGTIPSTIPSDLVDQNMFISARENDVFGGNSFSQKIVDISTFTESLSQAQVTNLYNGGVLADPTAIASCQNSYWCGDNTLDTSELIMDNVGSANMGCSNFEAIDIVTL